MKTGALIFAFNNEQTNYVAMAGWSSKNIKRHLGIPTTLVTDAPVPEYTGLFDKVVYTTRDTGGKRYFEDYAATVSWHNASRVDSYDITPYDQTLVLDADYVVASAQLSLLFGAEQDFLCHRYASDLTTSTLLSDLNKFGEHDMPMWWATVMMFRKSNTANFIFDSMKMIRNNWEHYRKVYNIAQPNYRNDYALSIALGLVSGHTLSVDNIPWTLASIKPEVKLSQLSADEYAIEYVSQDNKPKRQSFRGVDFHAMGKKHLGDIVANSL